MKEGETKTFTDDGKTITISRQGDSTHVKIEGAGETRSLTVTRDGDSIRIERDGKPFRGFIVGPERRKIIIDGVPFSGEMPAPHTEMLPRHPSRTMFVCPKDHTTLMVPKEKDDQTYKCPVDGSTMEKKKGKGFSFYFDDSMFESEEL
jgi:hypothetical protein